MGENCHDSHVQANACSAVGLSFALQRNNFERNSFNCGEKASPIQNLPCWISRYNSFSDAARNGNFPQSIKQRITPKAHISAGQPQQGAFRVISGAMYGGVPQQLDSFWPHFELKPKSMTLTRLAQSIRMFQSLRSRWQMRLSWQQPTACTSCLKIGLAMAQVNTLVFLSNPASDNFPPSSIISSNFRLSLTTWNKFTILWCCNCLRLLISLKMLSNLQSSIQFTFAQVFIAKRLLVYLLTASDTTEKLPLPRWERSLQLSSQAEWLRNCQTLSSRILYQSFIDFRAGRIYGTFSLPIFNLVERKTSSLGLE